MATHVALLRGINVGGRNKVAMADLRDVVSSLGHTEVSTYIQSGNVLFTAGAGSGDAAATAAAMERAIADRTGVSPRVVVLTFDELAAIAEENPYPDPPNPRLVHVFVFGSPPGEELLGRIGAAAGASSTAGESMTVTGRAMYLSTPGGYGRSDLAEALNRIVGSPKAGAAVTARNWATITRLLELGGR